jgi:hypothetical protein
VTKNPWTDPDPQPGDFDEYLAEVDPKNVQYLDGTPGGELIVIDEAEAEELRKRQDLAAARKPLE